MDSDTINTAIVTAIKGSVAPGINKGKLIEAFGAAEGEELNKHVADLVRQAVSMPIEWGDKTLEEGVNDILGRFHEQHPDLSPEALHEIGRCVGWNLR
jgi:hypothetical protein